MASRAFQGTISALMASSVLMTAFPSTVLADTHPTSQTLRPTALVQGTNAETLAVVVELPKGETGADPAAPTATDGTETTVAQPEVVSPIVANISNPANFSRLSGMVTVSGTADAPTLTEWKLEVAPSGQSTWVTKGSGTAPVINGTLAEFDTADLSDGAYSIRLTVTDASPSSKSSTLSVVVDNYNPTAQITSPVAGSLQKGTVTFTGTASDANIANWTMETAPAGSGTWTVRNSGTANVVNGTLLALDTAALPDGGLGILLTVTDVSGHSTVLPYSITVDNIAPSVVISDPLPAADVMGTVTVHGSVSDTNLSGYVVEVAAVGGGTWTEVGRGSTAGSGGELATFDTTILADGHYFIRVTATDGVLLTGSDTISVTVDNVNPAATITAPVSGGVGGAFYVTGSVSDGNLTSWILEVHDIAADTWSTANQGTTAISGTLATIDTTPLTDGDYNFRLTATDSVSRIGTSNVTVTVDNTSPVATLTPPPVGTTLSGSYPFNGAASDAHLKEWAVEYRLVGAGTWSPLFNGTSSVTGVLSNADLSALLDGQYDFRLTVTDMLDHTSTAAFTTFVDNHAPIAAIASPLAGAWVKGSIAVTGTASDGNLANWALEFTTDGTWHPVTAGNTSVVNGTFATIDTATLNGGVDGPYNLRLTVNDVTGNPQVTTVTIMVDNTLPTAAITSPANGEVVNGDVNIVGTADDDYFTSYTVEVAPTGTTNWVLVNTSALIVNNGTLATLNSTGLADGAYDIRLTVVDAVGNSRQTQVTGIVVDNTIPGAAILTPATGAVVTGNTVTITGTASDANLASWTLERSPVGLGTWVTVSSGTTPVTGGTLATMDTSALAEGGYDLRLTVVDSLNQKKIVPSTLILDKSTPTVSLDSLADGDSVRGLVGIDGTASDPNLASYVVEVSPDGLTWTQVGSGTGAVTNGRLADWNTNSFTAGPYDVRLTATDKAGLTATFTISAVTVDNTAPTAAITGPANYAVTTGTITVTGMAKDAGIDSWTLEIAASSGGAWSTVDGGSASIDNGTLTTIDTTLLAEVGYDLRLTVTDLAGNTNTHTISFTVDRTAPTVSISAPIDGAKLHGIVSITGTASDANLTGYVVAVSPAGANTWTPLGTLSASVTGGELWSLNTTPLPAGSYDVLVTATDATGAVNSATVTFLIENTAPTATITTPVTGGVHSGLVTVTGTADDTNLTDWSLTIGRGARSRPVNSGTTAVLGGALGSVDTTSLADGDYTFTLVVNDQYGNSSTRSTTFTVDHTPGTASITSPSADGIVRGTVRVKGSVADAHLATWTLGYASGSNNVGPYTAIATGTAAVTAGTLGNWSGTGLPLGNYTLALTVTDKAGNIYTVTTNVVRKAESAGGGGGGGGATPLPDTTVPVLDPVVATVPNWITKSGDAVINVHVKMTEANPDYLTLELHNAAGVAILQTKSSGKESDLSLTIPSSVADGIYSLVVTGVDKSGNTDKKVVQSVGVQRIPLGAPKLAPVPSVASKMVTLDWSLNSGFSSVGIKRYVVYRSQTGEFVQIGETTSTSFTDESVPEGTVSYKVVLESKSGLTTSVTTGPIQIRSQLPAPVLAPMPALITEKQLNLRWSAVAPDAQYDLYRTGPNGKVPVATNLTVTTFTDLVLTDGIYTYTVEAKDAGGNRSVSAGVKVAVVAGVPVAATTPTQLPVYVMVNGRFVYGDVPSFTRDNRTYAPVRFVAESLGATVVWDAATQTARITGADGRVITVKIGSKVLTVAMPNGSVSTIEMDVTAFIENGRIYIPVRFVAEALGLKVNWDSETRIVLIGN